MTATLADIQAVYSGNEGDLWELLMGRQIHIGGFKASTELATRAGIAAGSVGVDLCCCNGAGMSFLVRFRGVHRMTGIDVTPEMVRRGRARTTAEGLADSIHFVLADACDTGLPDGAADFIWGEDAWCYVPEKARLIREAVRLVKRGGTIAFTDWVAGSVPMSLEESERLLRFMKFPNIESISGYGAALRAAGCEVIEAGDTGRFADAVELYLRMVDEQFTYDALRLLDFNLDALAAIAAEMIFLRDLARAGKICQARFIAHKTGT